MPFSKRSDGNMKRAAKGPFFAPFSIVSESARQPVRILARAGSGNARDEPAPGSQAKNRNTRFPRKESVARNYFILTMFSTGKISLLLVQCLFRQNENIVVTGKQTLLPMK